MIKNNLIKESQLVTLKFFNCRDLHRHLVYMSNLVYYKFSKLHQEFYSTKCKQQIMKK